MGEDSIIPKSKKAVGSPTFVALVAMMVGAGGASAVTISFNGSDESAKPATAAEVSVVKEAQKKHETRIEQTEQGMITVRLALKGIEGEMKSQTKDIGEVKQSLQRMSERRGRRDNP